MAKETLTGNPISKKYGELLLDLSYSVLRNSALTQQVIKDVLKETQEGVPFERFERAWILKTTCRRLLAVAKRHGFQIRPSTQVHLDQKLNVEARLEHFDYFFHRLPIEDRLVLLLKDKYSIPYSEISSALNLSESSLKVKRQQALRTMEEWIWEET